eukprot:GHRQ01037477.1.p1 GENE.GHRQ01037477.1~~GHRQ01037477.1.p1  ORF type:complete len:171 (-),score=27.08 GHRQ01037477.1:175-687(-)
MLPSAPAMCTVTHSDAIPALGLPRCNVSPAVRCCLQICYRRCSYSCRCACGRPAHQELLCFNQLRRVCLHVRSSCSAGAALSTFTLQAAAAAPGCCCSCCVFRAAGACLASARCDGCNVQPGPRQLRSGVYAHPVWVPLAAADALQVPLTAAADSHMAYFTCLSQLRWRA